MTIDRLSLDMLVDGLNRLEAEAVRPEAEPEPKPLGRFRVRGQLGTGRFAVVALADDPVLKRQVALKLPRPELLVDERMRNRFVREAQAAARLEHEGIVPVHEVVQPGESIVYLVLGLVNGPNLEEWLERNPAVDEKLACQMVAAIADAIQHAHDRKVLHLDLKPSNILIDPGHGPVPGVGRPRVTDFGLARVIDGGRRRTTALFAGTPGFMAPEQLGESALKVSERTDVWALGAILFQVLTARPPFEGSEAELVIRTLNETPPSPRTLRPDLSPAVSAIVLKCLHNKPERRYGSARALAEDLRAVVMGTEPIVSKKRRWRRMARFSVGLAAAILAGILVFAVGHRDHIESETGLPEEPRVTAMPARLLPEPKREHFTNSIGMVMIRIEPGEFVMGSPKSEPDHYGQIGDETQRKAILKIPYFLGQCEVTRGQFRRFMAENPKQKTDAEKWRLTSERELWGTGWVPSENKDTYGRNFDWEHTGFEQTDNHPVVNVSWFDAMAFCQWLTDRDGRPYSLLTEAEWEYACRAGSQSPWPFGGDPLEVARYGNTGDRSVFHFQGKFGFQGLPDDGVVFTAPVRSYEPNPWGLYDMHGNAWEWCWDWYDSYRAWKTSDDPVQRLGTKWKVYRGGSYGTLWCRSAIRNFASPHSSGCGVGFRVRCESPADK